MVSPEPIYSCRHRSTLTHLLSPIIAAAVLLFGFLVGDTYFFLMGAVFSLWVWLIRHGRYEVFHDRLVVYYGWPRRKVLLLAELEEVRLVQLGMGPRSVFIRRIRGLGMVLRPTDPDLFLERLEEARSGLAQ